MSAKTPRSPNRITLNRSKVAVTNQDEDSNVYVLGAFGALAVTAR